jgi:hypothetical protein
VRGSRGIASRVLCPAKKPIGALPHVVAGTHLNHFCVAYGASGKSRRNRRLSDETDPQEGLIGGIFTCTINGLRNTTKALQQVCFTQSDVQI